jgi:hypothetical protein
VDQSWSWSFHFGPKNQSGLDFQALNLKQANGGGGGDEKVVMTGDMGS